MSLLKIASLNHHGLGVILLPSLEVCLFYSQMILSAQRTSVASSVTFSMSEVPVIGVVRTLSIASPFVPLLGAPLTPVAMKTSANEAQLLELSYPSYSESRRGWRDSTMAMS